MNYQFLCRSAACWALHVDYASIHYCAVGAAQYILYTWMFCVCMLMWVCLCIMYAFHSVCSQAGKATSGVAFQAIRQETFTTHINIPLSPYTRWYSRCYIETPSVQVTTRAKRIYENYGYIPWTTTISYNKNYHLHIHKHTTTTTDHHHTVQVAQVQVEYLCQ